MNSNWRDRAACLGLPTEAWYPTSGDSRRAPIRICRSCPVQRACLNWALQHCATPSEPGYWGIWGGTTERHRRRMRQSQEAA